MAESVAANKHCDACKDAVEEIERADCGDADQIKQSTLNTQVREGLMQALENSVCPSWLRLHVCHKPLVVLAVVDG